MTASPTLADLVFAYLNEKHANFTHDDDKRTFWYKREHFLSVHNDGIVIFKHCSTSVDCAIKPIDQEIFEKIDECVKQYKECTRHWVTTEQADGIEQ